MTTHMFSKENTRWMQGLSALMIMTMHFIMQMDNYPRFLNILGSIGVAVFLFVSGFGLNESYKTSSLKGYWKKRFLRVIIPFWIVILFQLPLIEAKFDIEHFLQNIFMLDSDLWFIDYIVKWYVVYWIGRKLLPRYNTYILIAFAVYSIFQQQLCSEQAFSFLCGYLASEHYDRIRNIDKSKIAIATAICCSYGCALVLIKELPIIQQLKGTLPFNILLLNIKLPLATFILALPNLLPAVKRIKFISWTGKISYELYIVHYNFMPLISSYMSVAVYSALSIAISAVFEKINALLKKSGHFVHTFAAIAIICISYFFMCKYCMRATEHYGHVGIAYAVVLAIGYLILQGNIGIKWVNSKRNATITFYTLTTIFVLIALALQYHFDPMSIRVDRWSAIEYPIDFLFNGKFPYLAPTHLGGNASPFPVWMVLHIPFYLLGNVGLSEIFSCLLFVLCIKKVYGYKGGIYAITIIMACLPIWYEIIVRSDLITNFLLLATFMIIINHRNIRLEKATIALGVFCGLWLSTRFSVAFPLFIMLLAEFFKIGIRRQFVFVSIIILTFAATFVPLILWDAANLFGAENNPFSLQFRQGHSEDTLLLIAMAIAMATTWKNNINRLMLYSAVILVAIPVIAYTHTMYECNNWVGFYDSVYDITYFDAALPFCITIIASMASSKNVCYDKEQK